MSRSETLYRPRHVCFVLCSEFPVHIHVALAMVDASLSDTCKVIAACPGMEPVKVIKSIIGLIFFVYLPVCSHFSVMPLSCETDNASRKKRQAREDSEDDDSGRSLDAGRKRVRWDQEDGEEEDKQREDATQDESEAEESSSEKVEY